AAPTDPATPAPAPEGEPAWPPAAPPSVEEEEARAAAEGEDVQVEREEELQRIRQELDRIRRERLRIANRELELEAQARDASGAGTSPVLAPRAELLPLTLEQAIGMALENNPDYLVELLRAQASQEEVPAALGSCDPVLSIEARYSEGRTPFFSTNQFSGFPPGLSVASSDQLTVSTSLSKRFVT